MDYTDDLEYCLETLRNGQLVAISTQAGYMLAADATDFSATKQLRTIYDSCFKEADLAHFPVVLLADQRSFLQHLSALDLAVFDWMESKDSPLAVWFDGAIGISDHLMTESGELSLALTTEEFTSHLIKRLRKPLAVLPMPLQDVKEFAQYTSSYPCMLVQQGFTRLYPFG